MAESFDTFLTTVSADDLPFIAELHKELTERGCKCEVKQATSSLVVSYTYGKEKKTLMNYVSRKAGMKARIYAENVSKYEDILNTLPAKLKKEIVKASICKRLMHTADCNSRCPMGYTFTMDGELYMKCRYMAFMPTLNKENNPFIREMILKELECREARQ